MQIHSRKVTLGVIALAALWATVIHALLDLPVNAFLPAYIHGDGYDYHVAAMNLYLHHFEPHPTRMFGYPLLTGWITLFNPSFRAFAWCCYVFNALCWIGSIWLLLRIGGMMFGSRDRVSLLPTILFGINIGNIVLISQAITETFYVFLLLMTIWSWLCYRQNGQANWLILAFATFCYSLIVRPTATPWLVVIVPATLWQVWQQSPMLKKVAVGMMLSLLLTVGLQVGLMKMHYNLWVSSNIGLLTYYLYIDAYATSEVPNTSWSQSAKNWEKERSRRKEILGMGSAAIGDNTIQINDWNTKRMIMEQRCMQTQSERLGSIIRSYCRNLVSNSLGASIILEFLANRSEKTAIVKNARLLSQLTRLQNGLYSFLAMLFASITVFSLVIRRKRLVYLDVLALFNVSIILLSAISFAQGDRFHVVIMPFVGLLLAKYVSSMSCKGLMVR